MALLYLRPQNLDVVKENNEFAHQLLKKVETVYSNSKYIVDKSHALKVKHHTKNPDVEQTEKDLQEVLQKECDALHEELIKVWSPLTLTCCIQARKVLKEKFDKEAIVRDLSPEEVVFFQKFVLFLS